MARNASRQLLLDQQLQKGESPSIGKRSGTPVNTGAGNKEKIECVHDFINFFLRVLKCEIFFFLENQTYRNECFSVVH